MLSLTASSLFSVILISAILKQNFTTAKTQFLFENNEGLPSTSSLSANYRLSTPKTKLPVNGASQQYLQDLYHFDRGTTNRDVIHIVDPPVFTTNKGTSPIQQDLRHTPKYHASSQFKNSIVDERNLSNHLMVPSFSYQSQRPTAAFLIKPQPSVGGNNLNSPQQELTHHSSSKKAQQFSKSNPIAANPAAEAHGYHFGTPQFYPLKVTAAVRHKHIFRTHPNPVIPHAKHRVHLKKFKTFHSKIQQKSFDFEEEAEDVQLDSLQTNITRSKRQLRVRRETTARHKSGKPMRGNLLPVALTIMGENGELLTGRALLQHITVLLKNASTFESNDDQDAGDEGDVKKQYVNKDVLLNEREFHRIMDNSMNLTDSVMSTVLGINTLNDSTLLTNSYVNEYLNCIDSAKTTNQFKALQNKIDCMKRKMFDRSNFDTGDSSPASRYAISNLPAALVYNDVMTNIKNLVRPKNGIAFYSLPVDELTHLQQVVLPIEDYAPSSGQFHTSQYSSPPPSNYQSRKIFFTEHNIQPRMPIWYVVKSDGRIYQMEAHRSSSHQPPIFHGFPDIPNADVFVDEPPRRSFFESVFFDD